MNDLSPIAAGEAAQRSLVCDRDLASAILTAAGRLLPHLERGQRIDPTMLRAAMEAAFGASDATGAWDWKNAYDACEAATVLFLRKYGTSLFRKADSPPSRLCALTKIAGLFPTHTRRSAESEAFQQFSTPIPLGLAALTAAASTPGDRVLEPSAGTGLLAILAEIAGGALMLNELTESRASLLSLLFPGIAVTRFDAAQIDDHLDPAFAPTVVLMNPPFSAMANVSGRMADAAYRHIKSALARLADGGRLVAITGTNFAPEVPAWRDAFIQLQERGRVVFSAAIDGAVYAKHGTTIKTRLTVIDKAPRTIHARSRNLRAWLPTSRRCYDGSAIAFRTALPLRRLSPFQWWRPPRQVPFAAISRAPSARNRRSHLSPLRTPSISSMRRPTGRRPRARVSATRSMRNTGFNRSGFPALNRIPPSSCSPRRWPRSRRRS
jgi:hypothetical protein